MAEFNQLPANLPINFIAGDDFSLDITLDESISGDTFKSEILDSQNTIIAIFTVTIVSTYMATISLTAAQTMLLIGVYNWYFERIHSSVSRTLLKGECTVYSR